MGEHFIELKATEGIFRGLAKQNLLFHQCICELINNAIAAKRPDARFIIDVVLSACESSSDYIDVYIVDNSQGMTFEILCEALQLGTSPTSDSRLNEHGFGLKNALATLSSGNGQWDLWTRKFGNEGIYRVSGPFRPQMTIEDVTSFPNDDFLPTDISTLIKIRVKRSFVQTVQGRGAPTQDLEKLREWLIEHLGVAYRGYLMQNPSTLECDGVIRVSIDNNTKLVPYLPLPIGKQSKERFSIELSGKTYELEYNFGTLDTVMRDQLVQGAPCKYYYQGNIPTQGIDIRLGKRVIATRQFESIWRTTDGRARLTRHNQYNDFLGELIIPELPRGVLTTVNNKTDFNLDDPDWQRIFDTLNGYHPPKDVRERSETDLRRKWVRQILSTNPDDKVTDEQCIWPTGTRIDVLRTTTEGKIIIYELKVGSGAPIHLYQLKMYWDGLVLQGKFPQQAILIVDEFSTVLEEMANMMNELTPPKGSKPYFFKIEHLRDHDLYSTQ